MLLQKDSNYSVKQALGESVTLANEIGLFRVAKINLDALGKEGEALREQLEKQAAEAKEAVSSDFSEDLLWDALKTVSTQKSQSTLLTLVSSMI